MRRHACRRRLRRAGDARRGTAFERVSGWLFFKIFNALSDHPIPVNLVTVRLMRRRYVEALLAHRERETMIAGLWALTGFRQEAAPVTKAIERARPPTVCGRKMAAAGGLDHVVQRPAAGDDLLSRAGALADWRRWRRCTWSCDGCSSASRLPGWPSLIVSVWMLGGLMLICLGIIGIYLSRVFIETKQRPYTIVRHIYERADQAVFADDSANGRTVLR